LNFSLQVPDRLGQILDLGIFVFVSRSRYILYRVTAIKVHALRDGDDFYWISILVVGWIDRVISPTIGGGHWFYWGLVYYRQFQARRDLLILLLGSRFFSGLVIFAFIPLILAQKEALLFLSASVLGLGAGGLRLPPVALL
jgi:hypothetical protein